MLTQLKRAIKDSPAGPAVHSLYLKLRYREGETLTIAGGHLKGAKWHRFMRSHNDEYVAGNYESEIQDAITDYLKPGMTFLDVGANAGFFSLLGSRAVGASGKVVAFEPHPVTAAQLSSQARLNDAKITVIEAAVCDKIGEAKFSDDTYSVMASLGKAQTASKTTTVRTTTIDHEVESRNLHPNLLKIDVEGAELDALNGAKKTLRKYQPALLIELHSEDLARQYHEFVRVFSYNTRAISGERFVLSTKP